MKTHLAAIVLAAATLFAPVAAFTSTSAMARTCGTDAPEGWEREGGFCDQRSATNSQATPSTGVPSAPPAEVVVIVDPCFHGFLVKLMPGQKTLLAAC